MRQRVSLAGQLLILQLVIVLLVLVAVAGVSLAQSDATFRRAESRRALSVAETVAATAGVRAGLRDPVKHTTLAPFAESARSVSGSTSVIIANRHGTILAADDPARIGTTLPLHASTVTSGRSWTGVTSTGAGRAATAHVPVLGPHRRLVGIVAVHREYPTVWESLAHASPNLLTYLGMASVLGVLGSLLLARRVKRQTLGLEPREITGLVEHRDAMLHGVKEGVIGVDTANRVTLVNDQAAQLLRLPLATAGRTLEQLGLDQRLYDVLTGRSQGQDQIALLDNRILTLNRMPIAARGRVIGSVTTMRDRTELVSLQRELDVTRHTTNTLRAQAHEFTNQLHTIAGLMQLNGNTDVLRYVTRISDAHARRSSEVTRRIEDPSLAALLIAKTSLAAEQGVDLRIAGTTRLGSVDDELSTDLVTVVGNLVDNALEELERSPDGWVEVEVRDQDGVVHVLVRDSGPGVAADLVEEVFQHGYTTKAAASGNRGFGLALTRRACVRRGGHVTVRDPGHGAAFAATLPRKVGVTP